MSSASQSHHALPVRHIPLSRPFTWIDRAWTDLMRHPGASLAYGWLVSSLGALILAYDRHPFYLATTISGFLLVGPLFTAGLCELTRRQERGQTADFNSSLQALRDNRDGLFGFAGRLLIFGLMWFGVCAALLYGLIGNVAPDLTATVGGDVLTQLNSSQIISYVTTGAILATIVFAISVVTVPLIIDRKVDASTAMRTSARVTMADLPAMLVWAALIVALVAIGFGTFLLGMVFIFPLLGHATWYAYKDLVK